MVAANSATNDVRARDAHARRIYRHSLAVRITHWINVLCLAILLMSGLQIFNAHPALYWGEASDFARPLIAMPEFPGWITIPSYQDLATGRVWHFFFAWLFIVNGLVYLGYSLTSGHLARDLVPGGRQLRRVGRSAIDHLRPSFYRHGRHAGYNVLQKLSYLVVVLVLLPLMLATGITMSPAVDAAAPWLLDVFAGRQSARTIHFIAGSLLVLFVLVHVVMVVLSGFANNLRSMITGWYATRGPQ
jgi:thiosulfate reductase cytochrome b subunit